MAVLRLSPLESLPTEILVLVLSAVARSPSDLGSLIRTSSTIHTCFKSFKVCILTAPALQDLGPAIIEAIALSCVKPLTLSSLNDPEDPRNETAVRDYVRQYHQLTASSPVTQESWPNGTRLQWITRDITPQIAESILRLNIAVQFFADFYLSTRLGVLQYQISLLEEEIKQSASSTAATQNAGDLKSYVVALDSKLTMLQALRSSMISSRGINDRSIHISMYCKTLSPLEQKRLYQAFLRVQLLVTLAGVNDCMLQRHSRGDDRALNPPPENQNSPNPVVPQLVARITSLYNPWELEQISQAQYFGFSLMTCVNNADDWFKRAPKGFSSITTIKWRLWEDRYKEITINCQFDLVGFRKRLLRGGAGVCLGLDMEQMGQNLERGGVGMDRGGCLLGRGFDSVFNVARGYQGLYRGLGVRRESEQGQQCYYEPLRVPLPTKRNFYEIRILENKLLVLPVSRKYHGRDMVLDELDHGDGMLTTFGPGPGAPQNVHQLECHIALRLMLLKGPGTSNGTCMATERTNIQWLSASHRFERGVFGWPPPGKPFISSGPGQGQGNEENIASDELDLSAVKKLSLLPEPYAWADALDGLSWDRWGMDFLPVPPEEQRIEKAQKQNVDYRFARWRYLGLVFWDEERVRDIRTALGDYHTGWLNRVWDE